MSTSMYYICNNPVCTNHTPLPVSDVLIPSIQTYDSQSGKTKVINRHIYVDLNKPQRAMFFLCDACHNAVQMTTKKEQIDD